MDLEAGESNSALAMLQSRLAQNPTNAQLNFLLAYVYLEQKAYVWPKACAQESNSA